LLISLKKPIVGHHLSLDIGLIFNTFLSPLPSTYAQFCQSLTSAFPSIFDTKVLSRHLQSGFKGLRCDLSSLLHACHNPRLLKPFFNVDLDGLENYKEKEHEAGCDALITGCAFVAMANFISNQVGRLNLKKLEHENLLVYSNSIGEVSLSGKASNTLNYNNTIVIQPFPKDSHVEWRQTANKLSKFGTLSVHENRGEVYYVFEEPQDTAEIIKMLP
jgi:hypothetical protein